MSHFKQIEDVLRIVLPQIASARGKQFTRKIVVTTEVDDFAVSNGTVRIHPVAAVSEKDPTRFCLRVLNLCEDYDARVARGKEEYLKMLQTQIEKWWTHARRAAGAERADLMYLQAKLSAERFLPRLLTEKQGD